MGGVCLEKSVRVSSTPNLAVLKNPLVAVVMVVIGDSVARAFSLVGALSIIRFRTVVQDARDIAFVFFALAVGMAIGAGNPPAAVIGTFLIGGIIIGLHRWHTASPNDGVYVHRTGKWGGHQNRRPARLE